MNRGKERFALVGETAAILGLATSLGYLGASALTLLEKTPHFLSLPDMQNAIAGTFNLLQTVVFFTGTVVGPAAGLFFAETNRLRLVNKFTRRRPPTASNAPSQITLH